MSKKILVTGVTGKQGGALAQILTARGHHVRGLTRNPSSEAAKAAASKGIEIVAGDFTDAASLTKAFQGVDAVFAMTTPFEAGEAAETAQGIALADAAVKAGVGHFVFTSVAGADQATGIPHFDSKFLVEQHLRGLDLPHTVIAPVYFMENLFFPQTLDGLKKGAYASPMPDDRPLQQIALADIGAFAAHVIEHRDAFLGKRIEIAGDELTAAQEAEVLSRVLDRPIGTFTVPMEQIRGFSEDMAIMYEWFISHGYSIDLPALRSTYPEVTWHSFEGWAKQSVPAAVG